MYVGCYFYCIERMVKDELYSYYLFDATLFSEEKFKIPQFGSNSVIGWRGDDLEDTGVSVFWPQTYFTDIWKISAI